MTLSPTKQALNTTEMLEYLGLSRTGLHRARTAPDSDFPQPYCLPVAPQRNLWSRAELDAWVDRNRRPSMFAEPTQLRGSKRQEQNHNRPQ